MPPRLSADDAPAFEPLYVQYIESWFFFDLFGGVPVDWAFASTWIALTSMRLEVEIAVEGTVTLGDDGEGEGAAQAVGLLKTMKLGEAYTPHHRPCMLPALNTTP